MKSPWILLALVACCGLHAEPTVATVEARIAARDAELDAAWRAVPDLSAFEAKCAAFKVELRRALGGSASARSVPRARMTGRKDYGAFRVEKVLLEGTPGAFVTALVFLPDAAKHSPPYAGFLFIPGHTDNGKGGPSYLHTCELGARNGLAAVVYDPLGQGERAQGAGIRNADEHVRIGAYAALLGETTATYMLRDAELVFDYFAGRADIDAARLGVSGNSGGGTLASYFMVVDDRVRAAAPSCYLSSVREQLLACGPQDAEQQFAGEQRWGFNHAALILSAGCPVLVNAAVDDFFQIAGSRATYGLIRDVAARVGLPADWYDLSEAPGPHAMSKRHRERAVAFLLKHLKGETRAVVETEATDFTPADCTVTPEGAVARLDGFRSIYDELAARYAEAGVTAGRAAARAKADVLREKAGADCRGVLDTLRGTMEKGCPAVLFLGDGGMEGAVTATLFADGPRLVRQTVRKGKFSYYERRQDDEVVAVDLYVEGRSLVALRAAEVLVLAEELAKRTGMKPKLVARGRWTTVARFAQAADPAAFAKVELADLPKDYPEALRGRDYLSFADFHPLLGD